MKITGVLLASGFGKRFGSNKLVTPFYGKPLFEHACLHLQQSHIDDLLVVSQYSYILEYCNCHHITSVKNNYPQNGQSIALHLGILHACHTSHFLFLPADQPLFSSTMINRLIDKFITTKGKIIVPSLAGEHRSPILFPNAFRQELLRIQGDKGGRTLLKRFPHTIDLVPFADPIPFMDIDTPADLQRLEQYAPHYL